MARPTAAHIDIEGYREFQMALKRQMGKLPAALGEAHKEVGKFIIDNLSPRPDALAVGEGAGSAVRPSATKRDLILRVGGKHRAERSPLPPWGKRPVQPYKGAPDRPYIVGTALDHEEEIREKLEEELIKALAPAFAEAED